MTLQTALSLLAIGITIGFFWPLFRGPKLPSPDLKPETWRAVDNVIRRREQRRQVAD